MSINYCMTDTHRDYDLCKRGYVFVTTNAAEIATIIDERRTGVCEPRPDTIPVHPIPPQDTTQTDEGTVVQ